MNSKQLIDNTSKNVFDIRSKRYDSLVWVFDNDFASQIIDFADPKPNDLMLDIGAGTGAISFMFHKLVKRVVALDRSALMLSKGEYKNKENVFSVVADGQLVCFSDNTFDLIVSRNTFHHFGDPSAGFVCVFNILKPYGSFLIVEPIAPNDSGKRLWSKLFQIRDKGRNPSFYYTHKELIEYISQHRFSLKRSGNVTITIPLINWLDTGTLSDKEIEDIYALIKSAPKDELNALGLGKNKNGWLMDHTWSLLLLKRIENEKQN